MTDKKIRHSDVDSEKKSVIQTVIVSCIIPFAFMFGFICSFEDISYVMLEVRYIARMILVAVPVLYYFVVMRKRKSDKLLDSHTRRIWLSICIQAGIMLVAFLIPFIYEVFFTRPEEGHWYGPVVVVLLIFGAVEPLIVHLGGCVFGLIFGKLILRKRLKNDNINKEA